MYETLVAALRKVDEYDSGYAKLMYDAADAIEELQKQRDEWESHATLAESFARGWIPVTERLPEDGQWVLVWEWGKFAYVDKMHNGKWMIANSNYAEIYYWMPLPEPPKEG